MFFIDFVTFIFPIVLYANVASDSYVVIFVCYVFISIALYATGYIFYESSLKSPFSSSTSQHIKIISSSSVFFRSLNHCDSEMAKLIVKRSINSLRTMIFVISSVVVLAVDFSIFPLEHRKSHQLGISLMDTGVGFYIMCNSLRVVRRSLDDNKCDQMNFKSFNCFFKWVTIIFL